MNSETILKTISDSIDLVAKKLGVAGDLVYPTLLKQANYQLVMDFIYIAFGLILLGLAVYITIKSIKNYKSKGELYDSWRIAGGLAFIVIIAIIILAVTGVTVITYYLPELTQILINPNWYILQLVKEMVG